MKTWIKVVLLVVWVIGVGVLASMDSYKVDYTSSSYPDYYNSPFYGSVVFSPADKFQPSEPDTNTYLYLTAKIRYYENFFDFPSFEKIELKTSLTNLDSTLCVLKDSVPKMVDQIKGDIKAGEEYKERKEREEEAFQARVKNICK